MRSRNILHSAFILGRAGAHAGTLAGTRNWSGCSSNCWAVTTTPQILEAGRPRPQEKGVPGHLPGQTPGHLSGQTLGQKLGILTLIPFHTKWPLTLKNVTWS